MSEKLEKLKNKEWPCPASKKILYFDALSTEGMSKGALPCIYNKGHDGNHVCMTTDGKPLEFERD